MYKLSIRQHRAYRRLCKTLFVFHKSFDYVHNLEALLGYTVGFIGLIICEFNMKLIPNLLHFRKRDKHLGKTTSLSIS